MDTVVLSGPNDFGGGGGDGGGGEGGVGGIGGKVPIIDCSAEHAGCDMS